LGIGKTNIDFLIVCSSLHFLDFDCHLQNIEFDIVFSVLSAGKNLELIVVFSTLCLPLLDLPMQFTN